MVSLRGRMLTQKVRHNYGTFSCEHPWKVTCNLYFFRGPKGTERKLRLLHKRLLQRRDFRMNEVLQLSNLLLLNPRFQAGLKAGGVLGAYPAVSY